MFIYIYIHIERDGLWAQRPQNVSPLSLRGMAGGIFFSMKGAVAWAFFFFCVALEGLPGDSYVVPFWVVPHSP